MIPVSVIPKAIYKLYNLAELEHKGYIYVEITKGMYGLPQAGCIANDELVPYLSQHGYIQCWHTLASFGMSLDPSFSPLRLMASVSIMSGKNMPNI